jgi:hypothetical protein
MEGEVGYSTNGYLVIEAAIKEANKGNGILYNKIFIFSDGQFWNSNFAGQGYAHNGDWENANRKWQQYRKINPEAKLYIFDLAGYGNVPINMNDSNVYFISGWSDRIFEVLKAIENGESALQKIKSIKL